MDSNTFALLVCFLLAVGIIDVLGVFVQVVAWLGIIGWRLGKGKPKAADAKADLKEAA